MKGNRCAPRHSPLRQSINARRALPQPTVGVVMVALAVVALAAAWHGAPLTLLETSVAALALASGLAAAIVVAYQYPIHVWRQTKVYLVTMVYYLLAVLVPPPLAAFAAGVGALAGELTRRSKSGAYPSDIATATGRRALMVLIAALLAHSETWAATRPPFLVLVGVALVLALLDAVSLPLVLAPMSGERPLGVLLHATRATALPDGVQYAVGVVGAAAAVIYPWTLPLLVVPAALVYAACKVLQEMQDSTRQLLENMADAVDLRDAYTGGHSRRVTAYSAQILRALRLNGPEVELILAAARVHDIGKIGIPDAVLNKPERLSDEERAVMEEHPSHGAALLKRHRDFARGVEIVRHHHERWDGSGYPDRLTGMSIPFGARVIAVADSYDAMTSDRPYRQGMPVQQAVGILREGRGRQWDAAVVDAFLRAIADQREQADTLPSPLISLAPSPAEAPPATIMA